MKLSLTTLFSRRSRSPKPLPTHDGMYAAHMQRRADDNPHNRMPERGINNISW